jgi:hypothetical protein
MERAHRERPQPTVQFELTNLLQKHLRALVVEESAFYVGLVATIVCMS